MSQSSNRPSRGRAAPRQSNLAPLLSALVVILVFVLLGVMLYTNRPGAAAQQSAAPPAEATAAPGAAQPTAAAAGATPVAVATGERKAYSAAPPMTIDPKKDYTATITTPRGDIVIKLRPDLAPVTVNNFVFLAREGFYNGLTWHRVLPNFMAQGGDPKGDGTGGPGYTIKDEFTDKVKFDKPGIVAMARPNAPDSAGSQFFITTAPADYLDGQYTIFGEVTKGQDVVNGIPLRDPQNPADLQKPGEQIVKITIDEK